MGTSPDISLKLPSETLSALDLKQQPFCNSQEAEQFYISDNLSILINVITQHIQGKSILMLIKGEQGIGKTSLVQQLLIRPPDDIYFISLHAVRNISIDKLFIPILHKKEILLNENDVHHTLKKMAGWIFQCFQKNRLTTFIVDDAHLLPLKTLENLLKFIRAINNQNQGIIKLLLFGQRSVENLIDRVDKVMLTDDVLLASLIRPFNKSQTTAYLDHKFKLAGYRKGPLFSEQQLSYIQIESGGIPGRINLLAITCLSSKTVTHSSSNLRRWLLVTGILSITILSGLMFFFIKPVTKIETAPQITLNPAQAPEEPRPDIIMAAREHVDNNPAQYLQASKQINDRVKSLEWLRQQAQDNYMIQITGSWNYEKLMMLANQLQLEHPMVYYQTERNGQPWHVLLYGPFPDKHTAYQAIQSLPKPLQKNKPWIRMLDQILKTL